MMLVLSYFAPLGGKIFFDRASGAGDASGVRLRRSASGAPSPPATVIAMVML